jgi:hypothetical protein
VAAVVEGEGEDAHRHGVERQAQERVEQHLHLFPPLGESVVNHA